MPGKKTLMLGLGLVLSALLVVVCLWQASSQESLHRDSVGKAVPTNREKSGPTKPEPQPVVTADATYGNARYGYDVAYPAALLKAGQEPDAGDGVVFAPTAGDADVRVWGEFNINGDSPVAILRFDLAHNCAQDKISFQVSKPDLIAYSCLSPRGRIVYAKTVVRAETMATVRFEYDPAERETWSPVIRQMANSLTLAAEVSSGAPH
jgi:hypothetical protein